MSQNPRFIMVGGFLGAGKTTLVSRIASHYRNQGKRIGIVTNDQATDLVDTHLLRSQGFDVGEVAGSCFCCNFDALTETVESLGDHELPEVVIAEPVGSCTDLVATVIRPLQQVYQRPLDVAPFGVIVKPSHGQKILKKTKKGGFSPQAEYIFRKQIEEADFVILNRIDELTPEQVEELSALVRENFGGIPCIRVSAMTGQGLSNLLSHLEQTGLYGQRLMDVDYDVYAAGEAELGWLNAQVTVRAESEFSLDRMVINLLHRIQQSLGSESGEVAHLKAIGMADGATCVGNLITSDSEPVLSVASQASCKTAELVINARIAVDPESLAETVQSSIRSVCTDFRMDFEIRALQSFRPGRPAPTHRM